MYVENWVFVDMIHLFRQLDVDLMEHLARTGRRGLTEEVTLNVRTKIRASASGFLSIGRAQEIRYADH